MLQSIVDKRKVIFNNSLPNASYTMVYHTSNSTYPVIGRININRTSISYSNKIHYFLRRVKSIYYRNES